MKMYKDCYEFQLDTVLGVRELHKDIGGVTILVRTEIFMLTFTINYSLTVNDFFRDITSIS